MDILYQVTDNGQSRERFLSFDAMISATPTHSAQVTERNVETGSNIADHVVAAQAHISVEAYVTNAPMQVPNVENNAITGGKRTIELKYPEPKNPSFALVQPQMPRLAEVLQFDQEFDRCKDAYEQMVDIVSNGRLVSLVVDRLPAFNDMVIVNLSAPITVDDGDAIRFTFEAVKIRFVDSQTVAIKTATGRKQRGHQGTQPATPEEEKSFIAAGLDAAGAP